MAYTGAPLLFMAVIILTIGNLMYLLQTSAAASPRPKILKKKNSATGVLPMPRGPSSSAELKSKIMKAVEEFCHGEFRDDVTLVVACIR